MSATTGRSKFLREAHEAERLAVTLGMGAAEVPFQVFLGVASFLVADDDAADPAEGGEPAGHGVVIAEMAVAVQLDKIVAAELDVIEHERPRRMAGDLHPLPGIQIPVNLALQLGDLGADPFRFASDIERLTARARSENSSSWLCSSTRGFSNSSG